MPTLPIDVKKANESLSWLLSQVARYGAADRVPCSDPECDSVYCFLAVLVRDRLAQDATVPGATLLRGLLDQSLIDHPLPWRIEHDWLIGVESKTGRVFAGTDEECAALITMAEAATAHTQNVLEELGLED